LAIVGWSWLAAELPGEWSSPTNANDRSVKVEANPILFLKAHLPIFSQIPF
jgi:hypothetical protein